MRRYLAICTFLFLIIGSNTVSGSVYGGWDWLNETHPNDLKRTLTVCFEPDVTEQWKDWVREAMANWNNAGSGWRFVEVLTFPCQVVIQLRDFDDALGGKSHDGVWPSGRIRRVNVTFDSNLSDIQAGLTWGRSGANTLDPVVIAKHELSHVLRLQHHPNWQRDNGNISDPIGVGNHNTNLSEEDKMEANESFRTTVAGSPKNVGPEGGDNSFGRTRFVIPKGALSEKKLISILPYSLYDVIRLGPKERIVFGAVVVAINEEASSFRDVVDPTVVLEKPMTVTVKYSEEELGEQVVGHSLDLKVPTVDEAGLKAYIYTPAGWKNIGGVINTAENIITFETMNFGIYGIGGPEITPTEPVIDGQGTEISKWLIALVLVILFILIIAFLKRK